MAEFVDPWADTPADEPQADPTPAPAAEEPLQSPPPEAPAKAPAKKAPAKAVGTVSVDVKPNLVGFDGEGKLTVTLKGGSGFEAPWIVVHAKDVDDALETFTGENTVKLQTLMDRVQRAAKAFAVDGPQAKTGGGGRPARQAAPAAATEPPSYAPAKPGDGWVYKSGVTKSGKNKGNVWEAWMPPQGSDEDPVWFSKN